MRVHTVNSASLTPGRAGNTRVNGAMDQRAGTQNMPTRNAPMTNNRHDNAPGANNRQGNTPAMNNNRPGNMPNNSGTGSRQRDLSQNRPPSAMTNSNGTSVSVMGNGASQRAGNSQRTWEAQGNATDRGHAPAGFGNSTREFAIWSSQWPGLAAFCAKLQQQPPKLFEQRAFVRAAAALWRKRAELRQPRQFAAAAADL